MGGWSLIDHDNRVFRETVSRSLNLDIIAICETFLRKDDKITLEGFKWIGHNRSYTHPNARRGAGGVGFLVRETLLEDYECILINRDLQDVLWVKLIPRRVAHEPICMCVCYLPPDGSTRTNDPEHFFDTIMSQVYQYQSEGLIHVCGDFNARVADDIDYIEGVDMVPHREVIDEGSNKYGSLLIDFLVDCNMCMLNGRIGTNGFTHVSHRGRSVVDYMLVPYEQLSSYEGFQVHTMTKIISDLNLQIHEKVSDHSLIECTLLLSHTLIESQSNRDDNTTARFHVDTLPHSFLNDEAALVEIHSTIQAIENAIQIEQDANLAYYKFTLLLKNEMATKLRKKRLHSGKCNKSMRKPYWNEELQELWDRVCRDEKVWLSCKTPGIARRRLKETYSNTRKVFDKVNRKYKRKYQLQKQTDIHDKLIDSSKTREFWKDIGRLGMANERPNRIPCEVIDVNGEVITDKDRVLNRWKDDYERLYSSEGEGNDFNAPHLDNIKAAISNRNGATFQQQNCDDLNVPITRAEVHKAVFRTKLHKSAGVDAIPAEVIRNDTCVDLLHKIIAFVFASGNIPSEWNKGIIQPLSKGQRDLRDPLGYRPITLISVPCKIYAAILNARLTKWLESNNIISDYQNGFRKGRSCMDHVYSLYSIVNNRKTKRKSTFVAFIDARKAFDTVNRDCLWYKLMSVGLHGKVVGAIQSLYSNVSCAVRVNDDLTEWFDVNLGVKQGCVLSPTLFSLYVNDLTEAIDGLHCGVNFDDDRVSMLLYADDIVLMCENETDLQRMLDVVNDWSRKWRMTINENKTKIVHFRPPSFPRSNFVFTCGNRVLAIESSYKYLGLWLNEFLDMKYSVRETTK
ncbi:MAG: reverse transcriptase family protein, partial [Sedimenticola sp.]